MKKHARGGTPIECPQCRGPFLASGLPKYRDGLMRNKNLEQLDKDVDELTRTNSSTALDICTIHLQCTQEPLGIFLYKFMFSQTRYGWKSKLQGNRPFSLPKKSQFQYRSCLLKKGYVRMEVNGVKGDICY